MDFKSLWDLLDEEDHLAEDKNEPVSEDLWEMKERLSRKREAKLAQKKNKGKVKAQANLKGGKQTRQNRNAVDTQPDFRL